MHLLLQQKGTIAEEGEAIDLGQSPGRIAVLTAADTEIAVLAAARASLGLDGRALRLVNLLQLRHPLSVDQWIERTGSKCELIVVRLLGGESYWPYGLEALRACAVERGICLVVLPGDDKHDAALVRYNTVAPEQSNLLWRYLVEGGQGNAEAFLRYALHLLDGSDAPAEPAPLLKAGVFGSLESVRSKWIDGQPLAAIIFYRALVQSGQTAPVTALCDALAARAINVLPVFVSGLKDAVSEATVEALFAEIAPDTVLNATGFAVSKSGSTYEGTVLDKGGATVLQVVLSSATREAWQASAQGLGARDLAMNIALPELDGRVFTRAISFKSPALFDDAVEANIVTQEPVPDRVDFVADLAANWLRLRRAKPPEKRVAIVLANYPNKDGRIANGVGLDTPAGTVEVLNALRCAGYSLSEYPGNGDDLIRLLQSGVTNAAARNSHLVQRISLSEYNRLFEKLPLQNQIQVRERWGNPENDPFFDREDGVFALPLISFGNVLVGIQPARGYNIDPKQSYHSPDLVPPHGYFAFYFYLREVFKTHAVIHMGKHGNMEWLPGKALGLDAASYPEATFGPLPHFYPFIVNDPGEGTQAKRRSQAVILSHLTPPLTRAENHGALKDLEALVDEYYQALGSDPRRVKLLQPRILDLVCDMGLDQDAGIVKGEETEASLQKIDAFLCDLKEMQIRDGLHIFGKAPEGRLLTDLTVALARLPRRDGLEGNGSLHRAIAADALGASSPSPRHLRGPKAGETRGSPRSGAPSGADEGQRDVRAIGQSDPSGGLIVTLGAAPHPSLRDTFSPQAGRREEIAAFDPLDCDLSTPWPGPKPAILADLTPDPWRTNGDTVERIELLAIALVEGSVPCPDDWSATQAVLDTIATEIRPSIEACGQSEISGLMTGLDGRFVAPGPSGAPTRGRPDVLPTGKNFYSVDTRAVPTELAWELGQKSAELLCLRHLQDHGDHLRAAGISAWGTSNMRTGGDDIAQAFALIGAKPVWERASGRVTGFEVLPLALVGRPRVDVTLRISGFFRDAFPEQVALFDAAARAVGRLEEDEADNPIAARMKAERAALTSKGMSDADAERRSGSRVFGSMPGAYGAGLQAMIDEMGWTDRADLAEAWMVWGSYAYGQEGEARADREGLEARLSRIEAVVQNQDNREHDLLDSDDYYQFEGGMTAAVKAVSGKRPAIYHNDHSRPERPVIRTLEEEIARVVRARVTNPKWIAGVMRHGYKGAFEIAATVDYLFAFSATTGAVRNHHFDAVYQAFFADEKVRDFMAASNPHALKEMAERLLEAQERGLWRARSNSARSDLERLAAAP